MKRDVISGPKPGDERGALDTETTDRLWAGIGARRRSRARRRRVAGASGLVAVGALAVWFATGRPQAIVASFSTPAPRATGPLRRLGGAPLEALTAPERDESVPLDDASVIALARGAHLEPRANTAESFVSHLDGNATFQVTPGGTRRWTIDCGLAMVDVIGTKFRIEEAVRDGDPWVRVSVEHGIVLVRGETVPDHVQRLIDGQSIEVRAAHAAGVTGNTESVASAVEPASAPASSLAVKAPIAPKGSSWRALASSGDYAGAYREVGPSKIAEEASHASVDDLLALGDVARLSGHPREAVAPLSRVMNEHGSDARAGVAAFTLGRIELDTLSEPGPAATAFARSIELGLPAGLAEDAYARLVEARAKAGDRPGAAAAAEEYARRFPGGSRSSRMGRWLEGD